MRKIWKKKFQRTNKIKFKEKTFTLKTKKTLKFFLHPNEKKKALKMLQQWDLQTLRCLAKASGSHFT